jgi:glycogen debranching enzyme
MVAARQRHEAQLQRAATGRSRISSSNPMMDRWLERSGSDLDMLTTTLPTGPFPFAGVPWYCTTFGRDGLLTAHQCLWVQPQLARGVLAFLASTQATEVDPSTDAEPGKILHEARASEMAATREVPFERYYGSVDATPLFVVLAAAYWRRTADIEFIRSVWPHIVAALHWMEHYGDHDGDGFVEYARKSVDGLIQQGWKDSHDSVFHADGRMAAAPIALCEVQGYVYAAKRGAAELARELGEHEDAQRWHHEAEALKKQFQQRFWCDQLGLYALALDGDKQPCEVASSNAGHALWAGIAAPEHAARMARRLLEPDLFSGWGLRTLGTGQARYNPMSYHNGSIWPHDNAVVCEGLARYGHAESALQLLGAAFEGSLHFAGSRLPELFCGFARRDGEGPTRYPVSCSPQAWAAAAVFGMLGGCLGVEFEADARCVRMHSPRLPRFVDWLRVEGLVIGDARVDLLLQRYRDSVGVDVTRRDGPVEVAVVV